MPVSPAALLTDAFAVEIVGSRRQQISIEAPTKEVLFKVKGPAPSTAMSVDDDLIRAFVETKLQGRIRIQSELFGIVNLVLQSYELNDEGRGVWNGVAKYGKRQPRQTGEIIWSFDGTGGQAHVTVSKETVGSYSRSGPLTPPVQNAAVLQAGGTLEPETTYWYVITATGNGGETIASNERSLDPTETLRTGRLSWSAVTNATGYRIYRTLDSGDYSDPSLIGATAGTSFNDTGLTLQPGVPPTTTQRAESAPSHSRAIGVNNDTVEGADIVSPIFKMTCQYYPSAQLVTEDYMVQLCTMQGTTNRDRFCGFNPGEVLYMGATGQPRGFDDWELTFHFIMSPNKSDLRMGDIENIRKGGHDYLWAQFAESATPTNRLKYARYAYVERVYDPANFALLGIGVDFPKIPKDDDPTFIPIG